MLRRKRLTDISIASKCSPSIAASSLNPVNRVRVINEWLLVAETAGAQASSARARRRFPWSVDGAGSAFRDPSAIQRDFPERTPAATCNWAERTATYRAGLGRGARLGGEVRCRVVAAAGGLARKQPAPYASGVSGCGGAAVAAVAGAAVWWASAGGRRGVSACRTGRHESSHGRQGRDGGWEGVEECWRRDQTGRPGEMRTEEALCN